MHKGNLKWLYDEMPKLISEEVLTVDEAERLQKYYGEADENYRLKSVLTIFGILGAVLIGAGIILLLARNWPNFTRTLRTVISFIPLLIGQIISAYVLLRKKESIAWREGSSAFLALSVGAAISLISQTYNISGDAASFFLTWMLLVLPLVYIMDAAMPAVFYTVGITAWAAAIQSEGRYAIFFWVLLMLLFPYVYNKYKENRFSNISVFLYWVISLTLCAAIGITLEKVLPGLWIIVYSSYFVILFITGSLWFGYSPVFWQRPLQVVGAGGILALSYILTYNWPWKEIGARYYRTGKGYYEWVGYFDYFIAAASLILALLLIYLCIRKKELFTLLFGVFVLLTIAGYLVTPILSPIWSMILFNLYLMVLGTSVVIKGFISGNLSTTNGGMLIIAFLAVLRFFDSEMGFAGRGIAFILVGAGFLVSNVLLIKKKRSISND